MRDAVIINLSIILVLRTVCLETRDKRKKVCLETREKRKKKTKKTKKTNDV